MIEYQGESIRGLHKKLQEMGFSRSLGAIGERKQKLRLIVHPDLNGDYSAQALAQGLGSSTTTVTAWIRRGWLRAHRPAGHELRGGATWVITPNAVRNFLIDYTAHVDFARADKYFLTDILTGSGREKAAAQETA